MTNSFFTCLHCGATIRDDVGTTAIRRVDYQFDNPDEINRPHFCIGLIDITYHRCPCCNKYSLQISHKRDSAGIPDFAFSYPPVGCSYVPVYVPEQIRNDYYEACSILHLSPKASATLSRRCLQGMIRDFWGVKEKTLYKEISSLEGKVPPDQWKAIDGLRKLGNIGAHMEQDVNHLVDIDPDEASKLVKLIEFLFKDWYIQRHEREKLYRDIIEMNENKQNLRHQ